MKDRVFQRIYFPVITWKKCDGSRRNLFSLHMNLPPAPPGCLSYTSRAGQPPTVTGGPPPVDVNVEAVSGDPAGRTRIQLTMHSTFQSPGRSPTCGLTPCCVNGCRTRRPSHRCSHTHTWKCSHASASVQGPPTYVCIYVHVHLCTHVLPHPCSGLSSDNTPSGHGVAAAPLLSEAPDLVDSI